jgi:hypothetical protein
LCNNKITCVVDQINLRLGSSAQLDKFGVLGFGEVGNELSTWADMHGVRIAAVGACVMRLGRVPASGYVVVEARGRGYGVCKAASGEQGSGQSTACIWPA